MNAAVTSTVTPVAAPLPATSAGLQVEGLSLRYGETLALDRVSFEVAPHEVVALSLIHI